jgi:uncharacterized membrane protein
LISALAYGIIFSCFTILRNNSFYSAGWDLGNFNQAFHTTLYDGKLFYYTADVFFSPSGSVFAIHTSPFLFLLIPFYALSPSPENLLVLKAFGIGLAAIPLYLLSKQLLKSSKAGFVVALVYLLYAPLQGANWFDFQQSAFLPLFVFLTYYFMIRQNWKCYFPTMLLALMVEEHAAIIVGILAVYYLSYKAGIRSLIQSLKKLKIDENLAPVLTIVICIAYLFIALLLKNSFPVNPHFAELYKATENYKVLGSSDTLTFPIYVLLHPESTFQALTYDATLKILYLVVLFGPLLFVPLRNRFVLGILFLLMPFLLSNYRPYYLLGIHYPFYVIPILFIATVYGFMRLDSSSRTFNLRTMFVVTLLFSIILSPLSPISNAFVKEGTVAYSPIELSLDQNKNSLNDLLRLIPSKASILTQNLIFPHVSDRINSYVIPFSDYGSPGEMNSYLDLLLNKSEYVLLDTNSLYDVDRIVLNKMTENNSYGPYALGRTAILYKREYRNEPINAYFVDNRTFLASSDLIYSDPPASSVNDPDSSNGTVLFYPKGISGFCVYGPYVYLLPGEYEVTFAIKATDHGPECLGTIDIATDISVNVPSFRDFYGFELKSDQWTNITLPLGLPALKVGVEFRVYSRGVADLFIDRIIVRRVSSTPTSDFSMKSLRLRDIKLGNGNITDEGFLIHNRGIANEIFWYGPYWNYAPGNYSVTFALKVAPQPQELNKSILTLDITGRTSDTSQLTILMERVLYSQDFGGDGTSQWHSFTMDFAVEKPLIDVEFRGLWPSPDYDVYLGFILFEVQN